MHTLRLLALPFSILLFTACDSTGEDKSTTDSDSVTDDTEDTEDTEVDVCATAWDDVAADDKGAWMTACVVPTMTTVLQDLDAERFAEVTCGTCHGSDYNGGTFAMPNTTALSWSDSESWPEGYYDHMATEVGPTMAGILGKEPYDAKTGEGFACANCHVFE